MDGEEKDLSLFLSVFFNNDFEVLYLSYKLPCQNECKVKTVFVP